MCQLNHIVQRNNQAVEVIGVFSSARAMHYLMSWRRYDSERFDNGSFANSFIYVYCPLRAGRDIETERSKLDFCLFSMIRMMAFHFLRVLSHLNSVHSLSMSRAGRSPCRRAEVFKVQPLFTKVSNFSFEHVFALFPGTVLVETLPPPNRRVYQLRDIRVGGLASQAYYPVLARDTMRSRFIQSAQGKPAEAHLATGLPATTRAGY
jgi:hypothetical protein